MQLIYYSDALEHHGIKGQKWGRRRYQNPDGSLTPMGRVRYGVDIEGAKKNLKRQKPVTINDQHVRMNNK